MAVSNHSEAQQLEFALKSGRIIATAMIGGVLLIAAIFAFLIDSGDRPGVDFDILTYVCLLLAATLIPVSLFLPKLMAQKLNANSSFSEILQIYRGGFIVSLALTECLALAALVSAFIQRQFVPEYLIAAFAVAMMLRHTPGKDKFTAFQQGIRLRTN